MKGRDLGEGDGILMRRLCLQWSCVRGRLLHECLLMRFHVRGHPVGIDSRH